MDSGGTIGLELLRRIRDVLVEHEAELTRLDSAIGDGDHGTNMARGFNAVLAKVEQQDDQSLAALLKTTAMTLISTVGGAAGPLYGTAFLRASATLDGKSEIGKEEVLAAFDAALGGIQARGKAVPGEKTMVDALSPAVEALKEAMETGDDLAKALERSAKASQRGMEETIPMVATKGRASYLGERSAGHQDPGATSTYLILRTIAETIREHEA